MSAAGSDSLQAPLLGNSAAPADLENGQLGDTPRAPSEPQFSHEDYTSLLYNLHAWSYRVSRVEFAYYSQRRLEQLQRALGSTSTTRLTTADMVQKTAHALTAQNLRRHSSSGRIHRSRSTHRLHQGLNTHRRSSHSSGGAAHAAPTAAAAAAADGASADLSKRAATNPFAQESEKPSQQQQQPCPCPSGPSSKSLSRAGSAQPHHRVDVRHAVRIRPLEQLKHRHASDKCSTDSGGGGGGGGGSSGGITPPGSVAGDRPAPPAAAAAVPAAAGGGSVSFALPPAASSGSCSPAPPVSAAAAVAAAAAAAAVAAAGGVGGPLKGVGNGDTSGGSSSEVTCNRAAATAAAAACRGRSLLSLPMLPATSKFMLGWAMMMLVVDLIYTAAALPLIATFGFNQPGQPLFWLSVFFGLLFMLDLVVVLHRAVVVKYLDSYIYVDDPVDVAQLYIKHGQFWPDLVVSLSAPLQLLLWLLPRSFIGSHRHLSTYVNVLVLLRGLRLIKLLMLQREVVLGRLGLRFLKKRQVWYVYSCFYILAVLLNWLACIMLFIAFSSNEPSQSWLASVKGRDLTEAQPARQWVAALYWMMVTTTTVGYGDVSGGTAIEQLGVIGAVLTGVCFIAYSISNLMDVLLETAQQDENTQRVGVLKERMNMLRLWATWQDLPGCLIDRITDWNSGPWLSHSVLKRSWEGVLFDLPPDLKGELLMVALVERHRELAPVGARLLKGLPTGAGKYLLALLEPRPLAPGQMLCWEGDAAAEIWLLQEGELVTLCGILPEGPIVSTPGLLVAMDLRAWLTYQQQQQPGGFGGSLSRLGSFSSRPQSFSQPQQQQQGPGCLTCNGSGRAPVSATLPSAGSSGYPGSLYSAGSLNTAATGTTISSSWSYNSSLQAVGACFLWALPINRLALALTCMPQLADHLLEELEMQAGEPWRGT